MRYIYLSLSFALLGCQKTNPPETIKFMNGIICKGYISIHDEKCELARAYPINLSSSTFIIEEVKIRDLNEKEKQFLNEKPKN